MLRSPCVVIDFETANKSKDSACAVGIAVVSDGEISDTRHWTIRPPSDAFSSRNVQLHGITLHSVLCRPRLAALWPEISTLLNGSTIIAHCADFDMQVLTQSLAAYAIQPPPFEYICTRQLARRVWPHYRRYSLRHLSDRLGIQHTPHNPASDAMACAQVFLACCSSIQARTIQELEQRSNVARKRLPAIT